MKIFLFIFLANFSIFLTFQFNFLTNFLHFSPEEAAEIESENEDDEISSIAGSEIDENQSAIVTIDETKMRPQLMVKFFTEGISEFSYDYLHFLVILNHFLIS